MKMKTTKAVSKKLINDDKNQSAFDWLNNSFGFSPEMIKCNKGYFLKCIEELIPHRDLITIVDTPKIRVSFDTGMVIDNDLEVDYPTKILEMSEVYISNKEDFEKFKRSKYLYIHSIRKPTVLGNKLSYDNGITRSNEDGSDIAEGFFLRMAEFTQGKRTVSFSIDEETYEKFLNLCDKMAINKSKFIENNIKEFLNKF